MLIPSAAARALRLMRRRGNFPDPDIFGHVQNMKTQIGEVNGASNGCPLSRLICAAEAW